MFYYEIWVRSHKYKSSKPLTYSSNTKLRVGQIVSVKLQNDVVLGFVSGTSLKPRFKTKEIEAIHDLPPLPLSSIKLINWVLKYYPSDVGTLSQQLLPQSLSSETESLTGMSHTVMKRLPKLTDDQINVLQKIDKSDTYLLHGRTGSGKTRIYIELIKNNLEQGKSSILLTPEISLTSQLISKLEAEFPGKLILIHSKQTPKQRGSSWMQALKNSDQKIVVGPRSALFAPINNLGLIIIDEAHENAYKQEQTPKYHANRVASMLSKLTNSTLVLGSATPSVTDYYLAQNKGKAILEMNSTAIKNKHESITKIIDLRDKSNLTKSYFISDELIKSINLSLKNNEQSLIYLNRRGTAKIVFCEQCGWEALCNHCNLPMTYHSDKHQLICHSCGKIQLNVPSICPECEYTSLIYKTAGTKAIVENLAKLFPGSRIKRFDTDNTKSDSIENNYNEILNGEIDIIVGTQLIAKGFDFPKLSTLGIIQADTSLYLPDFSSEERTFQLISQVLGRVNRGHISGRAIIQTYNPDNMLFEYAKTQNYKKFYSKELKYRKKYKLPPYYQLLKLSIRRKSQKSAKAAGEKLKAYLQETHPSLIVDGPSPAFHEKHGPDFEWHLVVKSTNRNALIEVIAKLPSGWTHDIDPLNLL